MAWINPIYDRTDADINYLISLANAIQSVGWANATQSQKDEWNNGLKGALNYFDLNRIQTNITYLKEYIETTQGVVVDIDESNPTWTLDMTPFLSNMNIIRDNILAIIEKSYDYVDRPSIEYTDNPNYEDINSLEKNLYYLYSILENISIGKQVCGAFQCGQNIIL